jgi:hypothetical protein
VTGDAQKFLSLGILAKDPAHLRRNRRASARMFCAP